MEALPNMAIGNWSLAGNGGQGFSWEGLKAKESMSHVDSYPISMGDLLCSIERAHKWIKLEAVLQGNTGDEALFFTSSNFNTGLLSADSLKLYQKWNFIRWGIAWTELLVWGFAGALFLDQKVSKCIVHKGQVCGLVRMAHQIEQARSAPKRDFNALIPTVRTNIINVICLSRRFCPIYIFISIIYQSVCLNTDF